MAFTKVDSITEESCAEPLQVAALGFNQIQGEMPTSPKTMAFYNLIKVEVKVKLKCSKAVFGKLTVDA